MSQADPTWDDALALADFRAGLAFTAADPRERAKASMMPVHLKQNRRYGFMSEEECFRGVYGPGGSASFWAVECSEPVTLSTFIIIMTAAAAQNQSSSRELEFGLRDSLRLAALTDKTCFVGSTTFLETQQNACWSLPEGPRNLRVHVARMAQWLLERPLRRDLVPPTLEAFLRPDAPPTTAARGRPSQAEVSAWMLNLYRQARDKGDPPPKRELEAFSACAEALQATEAQMKRAMREVPAELKRKRGQRSR